MIQLLAKPLAAQIQGDVRERSRRFFNDHHRKPLLAVILVGQDPASLLYTKKKGEMATQLEMDHLTLRFEDSVSPALVKQKVDELNRDEKVDGILIQRPLPLSFKEEELLYWIRPEKDVDAFHPENAGKLVLGLNGLAPCTPLGILELLDFYKIPLARKVACVVGRSALVGKPMASLLLRRDMTLLHCHKETVDLEAFSSQADLLIVATGVRNLIQAKHIKRGAVVVDVGINRAPDGKLTGDVLWNEVAPLCSAITPVPGGVGPMTIALLMRNTILAAEERAASLRL